MAIESVKQFYAFSGDDSVVSNQDNDKKNLLGWSVLKNLVLIELKITPLASWVLVAKNWLRRFVYEGWVLIIISNKKLEIIGLKRFLM